MIKFKKIRFKNILSVGNNFIEIELDKSPTNLFVGKNGRGKSLVIDAITFALFNKPFRKINKPQLVNNINKSNLEVEIEFESNKVDYKIRRGIKPNFFEIYEDGKFLNQDSDSMYDQEYLETTILNMNYKAFTQIVIIGSATYVPFMKLSTNDRRAIIENILDIDIFSKMNDILKKKVTKAKEDIMDISYKYDLTKEKIKLQQNSLNASRADIESQITINESEVNRIQQEIEQHKREIDDYAKELSTISVNESQLNDIRNNISQLSGYELSFKSKIKEIRKEIDFFNRNDVCSTCHQDIDSNFKANIVSKRQTDEDKYSSALSKATKEIHGLEEKLTNISTLIQKSSELNSNISKKNLEISYLEKEINRILQENHSLLQNKTGNLKTIENEFNDLQTELEELNAKRDSLLNEQHLNSLAGVLLKDDGIKTKIIRNYLPTMNKTINKYLGMMDFYVNFNLNENFEEVIKMANRENFTYDSFSEGEKLRIDLAILFTWREIARVRNSVNTNLLILDEVFDSSLDSSGVDDFLKIINTLSKNNNIFIISHKDEILSDKFTNVIKFEKVKGFSRIV